MPQLLKNNVSGVLANELSAVGTSMTLVDATAFPDPGADYYLCTLAGLDSNGREDKWEIVRVTAKASNTLTITRAQESTTNRLWPVGTAVQMRLTAGAVATKDDLTTKQPLDSDLTAIAAIAGTSGLLKKTAANTWVLDTAAYQTAQSVTGLVKSSGTTRSAAVAGTDYATPTGIEVLTNKTLQAGVFTDGYTEETVVANTTTAYTVNLANGSVQFLTLTGNCTYTFPTPAAGKSFTLVQKQDATGSRTVTWPASVKWPGGTAPTITSTASKVDKFVFTAIDGASWLGSVAGLNYTA